MSKTHSTSKPPFWKRALLRTTTLAGTGAVFLVAGGLVFGGVTLLAERADAVLGPEPAPTTSVEALRIMPQSSFQTTRRFHGQVEAAQSVDLAFEQGGELRSLVVEEGSLVEQGDVLASLDTRLLDAERQRLLASRRSLEAQVELAELTTNRQEQLRERGFASTQTVDNNRLGLADLQARIAEIDAAIVSVDVRLSQTQLIAPFDAQISARLVDEGSVIAVGQSVVRLLQDADPIFRVGIDPELADDVLSLADAAPTFEVTLGQRVFAAEFEGFRPDLDAQTRTRTALFRLQTDEPVFLQAGTLTLTPSLEATGYAVPLNALREGVRGLWTILTLTPHDSDNTFLVSQAAVEVVQLEGDTAFVRGTLDGEMLIIPNGSHRVVPGERVLLSDTTTETLVD